jgi:GDPmannose 4,6-dehydratase
MFGKVQEVPQKETTPFYPRSPYGVAKLYAYWMTVNYRESYGIHASNGILFNHESPRRGETFVTRNITKRLGELFAGITKEPVQLGNMDAMRDWGHARDFVEGMWLMLQQDEPDDYVLATGIEHSVRDFLNMCLTWYKCSWGYFGFQDNEYVIDMHSKQTIAQVNPQFYRPAEVNTLLGDPTKAKTKLGWEPKYDIEALVRDMCTADFKGLVAK